VAEHVVTKDGIGDLRSMNQVHLQKSGLEMALLGLVVLESVKQERGCGLDHILRHEDIDDLKNASCLVDELTSEKSLTYTLDVHKRSRLVVGQLSSKFGALVGVGPHDVLKQGQRSPECIQPS
jgi:hypothetical protein